jgi:hypothetical protein
MPHIALRSAPARNADLHPSNDSVFSETALAYYFDRANRRWQDERDA